MVSNSSSVAELSRAYRNVQVRTQVTELTRIRTRHTEPWGPHTVETRWKLTSAIPTCGCKAWQSRNAGGSHAHQKDEEKVVWGSVPVVETALPDTPAWTPIQSCSHDIPLPTDCLLKDEAR